ncbi:L-aspartate oxidase [Microbacterium terregens]|uniref:L-aspartate oxidase n=1 Tax=Microbacterium terregens TaxID=69363 RepID=A0ABV5SXT3_9MICO
MASPPESPEGAAPRGSRQDAVHAIVVGSGIAGLTVALHALQHGCRVTLVTKDVLEHANTRYAQGGIAGVMFEDDRAEDHVRDTLTAGAGLSDPQAVRVLVDEGPARIRELITLGVEFDRNSEGAFVKGLEAAHSYPRILHSGGDATGTAIEKALVAQLRASSVRVIEHAFLVDLVRAGERVTGVDLLIGDPGPVAGSSDVAFRERIAADAVVLATGGAGELYAHTTNPAVATGDGIAAALRAGAEVTDLEFFQFHPTVLEGKSGAAGLAGKAVAAVSEGSAAETAGGGSFLVSEAVRGEGATLIDETGRRFAFDAHPDGELAPRDVVARAIARQMEAQDGRPVFLDATHLRATPEAVAEFLARRFPTIDRAVRERGLDWSREPIPVTPAAHYLMGGVTTDLAGRTSLRGLYAVGEVARTGVHGANRLASNSLLEGAVFGARAGDAIASDAASGSWPASRDRGGPDATVTIPERVDGSRPLNTFGDDDAVPLFSRAALQELMWEDAGLVRDAAGLEHAASVLASWRAHRRAPRSEAEFEDENLLVVAGELVGAALRRRESVGAHFRRDAAAPDRPPVAAAAVLAGRVA